jgi:hypothetical protein
MGLCHLSGEGENLKNLRFYHVNRDNKDIYLFSNEAINDTVDAYIDFEQKGKCLIYEPWENRYYQSEATNGRLHLKIENGNMIFVIFGDEIPENTPFFTCESERENLKLLFDISVMGEDEKEFTSIAKRSECFDISAKYKPDFSGNILYEATFLSKRDFNVIDLGQVGEVCEVYLNDEYIGARINAPYKFNLKNALCNGENRLKVIVKNNLAHKRRDSFSSYLQIPPSGIIGDISLCKYSN